MKMEIVLAQIPHKALWSMCGGKRSGNSSRRSDDGKGLLDEAKEYMRPEEIVLRLRFMSCCSSSYEKELEGPLPQKLNLKVLRSQKWPRPLPGQEEGWLPILDESGGWISI